MKIANVYVTDTSVVKVWVEDHKKVGDFTKVNGHTGTHPILGFLKEEPFAVKVVDTEEEYVDAGMLESGDVFLHGNDGWCEVLNNHLDPRSQYAKLSVIPEKDVEKYRRERISGLYLKVPLITKVLRKTRKYIMSTYLISSHNLVKEVQAKLMDLSALENAPDRLEVSPSVFVDKKAVTASIKTDLRAAHSQLGEVIKRL